MPNISSRGLSTLSKYFSKPETSVNTNDKITAGELAAKHSAKIPKRFSCRRTTAEELLCVKY